MSVELGDAGVLAKVTAISNDGYRVYFDLRNGSTGSFEDRDDTYSVGEVLLLITDTDGHQRFDRAPASAWPDDIWIGVVKLKHEDVTVVESGGRLRRVPTADDPEYEVGNTVEASDTEGVLRILSEDPIKYLDLPAVDDKVIDRFKKEASSADDSLTFDHFGGLPEVVDRARELIEVPLQSHEALAKIGARPIKGVLFTGDPGTGKTMLARIIASQAKAAFFEISGPEIFSKWYGQSEELLRRLFERAAEEDRAIIFFDEIDSVAGQRDDDAHEASKRVVAQLLTLMDGFTAATNVVVIATTNRPQDLDVALRRPGRFDWEIPFPLPSADDRYDILMKTAMRLRTSGALPHRAIAAQTDRWSAAELAAIWSEAALLSVQDHRDAILVEDYIGGFERVARQRNRLGQAGSSRSASK